MLDLTSPLAVFGIQYDTHNFFKPVYGTAITQHNCQSVGIYKLSGIILVQANIDTGQKSMLNLLLKEHEIVCTMSSDQRDWIKRKHVHEDSKCVPIKMYSTES